MRDFIIIIFIFIIILIFLKAIQKIINKKRIENISDDAVPLVPDIKKTIIDNEYLYKITLKNNTKPFYFLDTETTGLKVSQGAELVEVAIIDENKNILLNTLVKPKRCIPIEASKIHGITDELVINAPPANEVIQQVYDIIKKANLVIYNAEFDIQFFADIFNYANSIICAMKLFSNRYGYYNNYYKSFEYVSLERATAKIGYKLPNGLTPHRALADCFSCSEVFKYLQKNNLAD